MTAAVWSLLFEQGVDGPLVINQWTDNNGNAIVLTGYSAELKIRSQVGSPAILFDMTTENGAITISGSTLTVDFSSEVTQSMVPLGVAPVIPPIMQVPVYLVGVYELRVTSPGGINTSLLRGNVQIILGVV